MRVFHTVANTSSCGKVEQSIKWPQFLEEIFKIILLFDIEFVEAEVFVILVPIELTQSPIFETDVIIIVEIVDTDHLMPIVKQFPTYLRGDKACNSGNEIFLTQA